MNRGQWDAASRDDKPRSGLTPGGSCRSYTPVVASVAKRFDAPRPIQAEQYSEAARSERALAQTYALKMAGNGMADMAPEDLNYFIVLIASELARRAD